MDTETNKADRPRIIAFSESENGDLYIKVKEAGMDDWSICYFNRKHKLVDMGDGRAEVIIPSVRLGIDKDGNLQVSDRIVVQTYSYDAGGDLCDYEDAKVSQNGATLRQETNVQRITRRDLQALRDLVEKPETDTLFLVESEGGERFHLSHEQLRALFVCFDRARAEAHGHSHEGDFDDLFSERMQGVLPPIAEKPRFSDDEDLTSDEIGCEVCKAVAHLEMELK